MTRRAYFETPKAKKPGLRFNPLDIIRCKLLRALEPEKPSRYKRADIAVNYAGAHCVSYYPHK